MEAIDEKTAIKKMTWSIVPLLFAGWFVNYLDRANIGFAALQMNQELGLSPAMFGFAAGIFYLGYILFEVPSNWMMHRFGARKWLARIMFTWGLVAVGIAFVKTPTQLAVGRVLLGVVEAGFFPCVLFYLASWFPAKHLGKAIGQVYSANIIALVIGFPMSGLIMQVAHEVGGFSGWRWMMVIEGAPAVLLGIVAFFHIVDKPANARGLSESERNWLVQTLEKERAGAENVGTSSFKEALVTPMVWFLGFTYFCMGVGFFGISTWLPQVIKQMTSMSMIGIGLVGAIPFLSGAIAMILNGKHSDRTGERRWHLAVPLAIGALGLAGSGFTSSTPIVSFLFICVAATGIVGSFSVFWTVPPTFLAGAGAAGGMALINAISGLAGFFAPWLVGVIRGRTPDFTMTLYALAVAIVIAALLAAFLPYPRRVKSESVKSVGSAA
jgi:MFS family permease